EWPCLRLQLEVGIRAGLQRQRIADASHESPVAGDIVEAQEIGAAIAVDGDASGIELFIHEEPGLGEVDIAGHFPHRHGPYASGLALACTAELGRVAAE